MTANGIIPIDPKAQEFNLLMNVYRKASNQILDQLNQIKDQTRNLYGYDIINSITSRIKAPNSIINKMKNKNYKLNYKSLIENINDIAGIRVVCPLKNDIYMMIDIIQQMPNVKILKTKDYMRKAKASGYSGYHLIIETPVEIEEKFLPVKVEIQLRTMAMDFWATNEHRMKYKPKNKISFWDSKKLTLYAKILNILDNKMMKINKNYKT